MHRAIPVGNKVLSKRWEERNQAAHYEKLRTARPAIDSNPPFVLKSHGSKGKKDLLAEERYTEIERENRILLEKMSVIIQNPQYRSTTVYKKSLNIGSRKRELVKITMENQALLRRLKQRQSSYSTQHWQAERRKNERILKNICEYPYQLGEDNEEKGRGSSLGSRLPSRQDLGMGRRPTLPKKPLSTAGDHPRKLAPLPHPPSHSIIYKKGLSLNDKYFLIEISEHQEAITISAFDIENPESYTLELSLSEAVDLMDGERDYEKLLGLLSFEGGDLILVDRWGGQVEKGVRRKDSQKHAPGLRKVPSQPQARAISTTPSKDKFPTHPYGEVSRSLDHRLTPSPLTDLSNRDKDIRKPTVLLSGEDGGRKRGGKRAGKGRDVSAGRGSQEILSVDRGEVAGENGGTLEQGTLQTDQLEEGGGGGQRETE